MVRHIVMYRLKDENKEENARQMKEKLEGLNGKIEGLHGLRIDRDCNSHQYDVCLTADFDNLAALKSYKNHPLHVGVCGRLFFAQQQGIGGNTQCRRQRLPTLCTR